MDVRWENTDVRWVGFHLLQFVGLKFPYVMPFRQAQKDKSFYLAYLTWGR
jgi:hypothetical protein